MLTRTNSASADYQNLRGYIRLSTQEIGPLQTRFHLNARGKKGLDEHLQTLDRPYEHRGQVQQAYLETKGTQNTRLFIGRHQPPLRGIGNQAIDGLSIQRETTEWSARISGGFQVTYWKPNAAIDTAVQQWGGEIDWHPSKLPLRLQAAALNDRDTEGGRRARVGLRGSWQASQALHNSFSIEFDPQENRLWAGRVQSALRIGQQGRVHASYSQRLATPYPVFSPEATPFYGGKTHALSFSGAMRQGQLSTRLYTRLSFGARALGSERFQLIWHRLPFTKFQLKFNAQDSWSPWRRIEQGSISLDGHWSKRVYLSLGAKQSFFKWNTSRQPVWRARTRPHIVLRYTARAGWSTQLKIEEIVDEYTHLRTRATAGLSYSL